MLKFLSGILKIVIGIVVAALLLLFLLNKGCEKMLTDECERGDQIACEIMEEARRLS